MEHLRCQDTRLLSTPVKRHSQKATAHPRKSVTWCAYQQQYTYICVTKQGKPVSYVAYFWHCGSSRIDAHHGNSRDVGLLATFVVPGTVCIQLATYRSVHAQAFWIVKVCRGKGNEKSRIQRARIWGGGGYC